MIESDIVFRGNLFTGRSPGIATRTSRATLTKASLYLEGEMIRNTPVGVFGTLRRSWFSRVTDNGQETTASIINPIEYALPVELGRRAAPVPIEPIELWVRRKLGVPQSRSRQVAFIIAKKKARQRTPGQLFATNTFDASRSTVEKILNQFGADFVEDMNR